MHVQAGRGDGDGYVALGDRRIRAVPYLQRGEWIGWVWRCGVDGEHADQPSARRGHTRPSELSCGCAVGSVGWGSSLVGWGGAMADPTGASPSSGRADARIAAGLLVGRGWLEHHAVTDPSPGGRSVAVVSTANRPVRPLSQLPPQAAQVWQLIQHGGPFPYPQDGTVFGNREGRLPARQAGFYREYTVPTPGDHDRGP